MARRVINIGSIANDGTGDNIRDSFDKINQNFQELYTTPGSTASSSATANTLVLRDANSNIFANKVYNNNGFSSVGDLPTAATYTGMFVYVTGQGAYYSNGTSWKRVPSIDTTSAITNGVLRWNGTDFVYSDAGVMTLNGRSGAVTLLASDISSAYSGSGILTDGLGKIVVDSSGNMIFQSAATGYIKMPSGSILQRPLVPSPGMFRYNSENNAFEGYVGPESGPVGWRTIGPLGTAPATFTTITVTDTITSDRINSNIITGPVGSVTANSGRFTTINATGAATFANDVGITGSASTGVGTGALVIAGGGSVSTDWYVGNLLSVTGNTKLNGTLAVTGSSALSATVVNGTLGVTGNTSTATLDVTGNAVFNRNVTLVGSNASADEYFKIQNASGANKFTVDSSTGNTAISGTMIVDGHVTLEGVTSTGATGTGNLVFNTNPVFAGTMSVGGVDASGNAIVRGNLTVQGTVTNAGVSNLTVTNKLVILNNGSSSNLLSDGSGLVVDVNSDPYVQDLTVTPRNRVTAWTASGTANVNTGADVYYYYYINTSVSPNLKNFYTSSANGTFGSTAPTHTTGTVANGTVNLTWVGQTSNTADPSILYSNTTNSFDFNVGIKPSTLTASKPVFTDSNKVLTSSGTLGADQGGTGQSTFTLGDTLYASGSAALSKLAGNTTTTKKFLIQTGTGSVSAAPMWDTISDSDFTSALYKTYTSGVPSPTPEAITASSIHGFMAYNSTDFPGSYYTGWTVNGPSGGAQLAIGWDVDNRSSTAEFTGSISGTTLTVTNLTTGTIVNGKVLSGSGILGNTTIVTQTAGYLGGPLNGGLGTYTISQNNGTVSSRTMKLYTGLGATGVIPSIYIRANDDTGDPYNWGDWERVLTSNAATSSLSVTNVVSSGYIQPSAGSGSNGIIFPADPGGGSGDSAKIQYYVVSGEQCELLIAVTNDSDDNITLTTSGLVKVTNNLSVGGLTASKPVFTDSNKKLVSTGTVPTDQGGTGLISFTQYGVLYASTTNALATSSALTFNGTNLTCTGNITAYSDARIKKNFKVIDNALAKVNQLSGYTFERTDIDVGRQTGVIAQEVSNVLPEAVTTTEDGMYTVAYGNMVGLLIESIKELNLQVEHLKAELQALKNT